MRARVREVDQAKRALVRKQIHAEILSAGTGSEKLDDTLSRLTHGEAPSDLPQPSSDQLAWWNDFGEFPV